MKCLHCREYIFVWARRCDHCGAPTPRTSLPQASDAATPVPDLATIQATRHLRHCGCLAPSGLPAERVWPETHFHSDIQDTESEGWKRLLDLVEVAAQDEREVFEPFREMTREASSQVITLPPTIGKLKTVRALGFAGTCLVRVPPEIGDMKNLVVFDAYISNRLHWFPYEITRCARLDESCVSTRRLYGNYKYRPPFPRLEKPLSSTAGVDLSNLHPERYGAPAITTCSICRAPLAQTGLHQVWISLKVGTDVLPLLVNACSANCVARLPPPAPGYVSHPHTGGLSIEQPPPE
jgi:hypothetical protein